MIEPLENEKIIKSSLQQLWHTCVVQSKRVILMIWVDALITLQEQGTWDVFRIKLGGKIFRKKSSCFEIDDRSDVNGTP